MQTDNRLLDDLSRVATGVWALWWDDVRGVLHLKSPDAGVDVGSATPRT